MTTAEEKISATIFSRCASIDFGAICPSPEQIEFYGRINGAVTELARSLPKSMQAEAMLFVMAYAGLRLGDRLDFFRNYYAPIWSCLFWLLKAGDDMSLSPELANQGVRAHALAMMLHSLDDHLTDGEVPPSHLALLLRSQAWKLLHESLAPLAAAVPGGADTVTALIDYYYSGITSTTLPGSLDGYCALFEKQMATGLIVPLLLARAAGGQSLLRSPAATPGRGQSLLRNELEAGVRASLIQFGIAWRLLDDIRDLEDDLAAGRRTGVYWALPEEGRRIWGSEGSEPEKARKRFRASDMKDTGSEPVKTTSSAITIAANPDFKGSEPVNIDPGPITIGQNPIPMGSEPVKNRRETIAAMILDQGTIDHLVEKILSELDQAALHADKAGLPGLAAEFRILAEPLRR